MWTFEQWIRLLSVLAWPAVAVISGWTLIRACKILGHAYSLRSDVIYDMCKDAVALSREWIALHQDRGDHVSLAGTCERAFLAILAANGGIPASREEKAARALVREIREMYAEIESPTKAPPFKPHTGNSLDYDLDPDLDEETADHVYAQFATDELDAQDSDDRSVQESLDE